MQIFKGLAGVHLEKMRQGRPPWTQEGIMGLNEEKTDLLKEEKKNPVWSEQRRKRRDKGTLCQTQVLVVLQLVGSLHYLTTCMGTQERSLGRGQGQAGCGY